MTRADGPTQALPSLGGKPAPDGLGDDLRAVLRLPDAARAKLWSVLGPCLTESLSADAEAKLDAFCRAHRLEREQLARPVNGCRFLLREAARCGADRATFASDLRTLCDDDSLEQLLLAGYDAACQLVRQEILQSTLADHGRLLVGMEWRVDAIQASSRGPKMRVPVAILTLRFREGEKTERITLQVLPDMLRQLRETLPEIVL
jgi:hypothetical protein